MKSNYELYGLKNLRKADLRYADLQGANFNEANLRMADLEWANLEKANLKGANLKRAYLRGADLRDIFFSNNRIKGLKHSIKAPVIPDIHKRLYDAITSEGCELNMRTWHTCETTHCRAGWIVTLAGEKGKKLEKEIGTCAAAAFIYMTSDPEMEVLPDFFASNEEAMEDIKRLAEEA